MAHLVELKCLCGGVRGKVEVISGSFFHVHCLCIDCQHFAVYLNNEANILDVHGGTELFQTYPAHLKITEGKDKIGCVQLSPKGLYRWHTKCCNMPIANTMRSPNVPFVGLSVKLMSFSSNQEKLNTLGPVTVKAFGKYAKGDKPADTHAKFPISGLPKILAFMLRGMLRKMNRPHPFFNDKIPIAEIDLISL
ncbi:DUF6151 family protein [Simiduia curdlanivorans]|uniref:DUF6151 family protein n=1 Tax=Simiduia curdlanivorans TaxID=1492769 RepID=A0ABV8V6B5_9GAMM|nr:DUF6151 family protein [Simiduia curdlanivorans]MDN3640875.1 DUF6151 family protein [Simiduia curdlanivorans]